MIEKIQRPPRIKKNQMNFVLSERMGFFPVKCIMGFKDWSFRGGDRSLVSKISQKLVIGIWGIDPSKRYSKNQNFVSMDRSLGLEDRSLKGSILPAKILWIDLFRLFGLEGVGLI